MAKATVLQMFPYSADGRTVRLLDVGEIVDIRPAVLPGLVESGQVAPVDFTPAPRVGGDDPGKRRK